MSPIILVGAGTLVLGLGLGFLLAYVLGRREASKASDVQNELDEYRTQVTEHFSETAQHFQALGQQYQSLYQHMAKGAGALCDPAQADAMLEFPAGNNAALAATIEEREDVPEVIKDYAPAEESKPAGAEAEAEEPEKPEAQADVSAAEETKTDLAAEEGIADAIGGPEPDESERTVH